MKDDDIIQNANIHRGKLNCERKRKTVQLSY